MDVGVAAHSETNLKAISPMLGYFKDDFQN